MWCEDIWKALSIVRGIQGHVEVGVDDLGTKLVAKTADSNKQKSIPFHIIYHFDAGHKCNTELTVVCTHCTLQCVHTTVNSCGKNALSLVCCPACSCNVFGSEREDCEQTTGQCVCKHHVTGKRCDTCTNGRHIGPHGCKGAHFMTSLQQTTCLVHIRSFTVF